MKNDWGENGHTTSSMVGGDGGKWAEDSCLSTQNKNIVISFFTFSQFFHDFFRSQDGEVCFGFLGNPLPKTKEMLSFTKEIWEMWASTLLQLGTWKKYEKIEKMRKTEMTTFLLCLDKHYSVVHFRPLHTSFPPPGLRFSPKSPSLTFTEWNTYWSSEVTR